MNLRPTSARPHATVRRAARAGTRCRALLPAAALGAVTLGLVLTGCGSSASSDSKASGSAGTVNVVASTNVYGDIATQIGKDHVKVTSIISDPNQDPHEFESSPQNKLAISKGQVLIANGGGYDDFFTKMAADSGKKDVINVVGLSGLENDSNKDDFNEHVWYNMDAVNKLADKIADSLGAADSADKAEFTQNAADFKASVAKIIAKEADIKKAHDGETVALTEPVPLWMLQASGLENKTPSEFSEAVENGNDAAPDVIKETEALFSNHEVKMLAFNSQAADSQSDQVKKAAQDAAVPVVGFTETLPAGKDYLTWMNDNVDNISAALK